MTTGFHNRERPEIALSARCFEAESPMKASCRSGHSATERAHLECLPFVEALS
jgi:hypothetical protein